MNVSDFIVPDDRKLEVAMLGLTVLACGGRDYADYDKVAEVLGQLHTQYGITTIVHGAAKGADTLAEWWARANNVENKAYPAEWGRHGNAAGPIRNLKMLSCEKPHVVVAFPGGRGTDHMKKIAKAANYAVVEVGK